MEGRDTLESRMVGIDIVDVSRIARTMDRRGAKFLEKLFSPEEMDFFRGRKSITESVAGRFAAKEAFMKAQGRRLPWRDIEVLQKEGRPYIRFKDELFQGVSISHERTYAVAMVVI